MAVSMVEKKYIKTIVMSGSGKMLKSFFLIAFLFLCVNVFSQDYSLDSIKKVLATPMHDTTRLSVISVILENENQRDSISIHYNKQVIQIIAKNLRNRELSLDLKKKYLYYLGYWYTDKAVVLSSIGSSKEVVKYINQSIDVFKFLGMNDEYWIAVNNKGNALRKSGEYELAISCFFEALKHNELTKNAFGIAAANSSIGTVYEDQNDYTKAIMYYKKALDFYDTIQKPENKDLYEQAVINHNIGFCYFKLGENETAKKHLYKALDIEKENGFLNNISYVYDKIGSIYLKQKEYDKALDISQEGLSYASKDRSKAILLNSIGEIYFHNKNYKQAELHLNKALVHAKLAKDLDALEYNYLYSYRNYQAMHQFEKALQMFELYTELTNSNNAEASKNALAQQQLKYDYEKKEFQFKLDQEKKLSAIKIENERKNTRKNIVLYLLISTAIILSVTVFYLYKFFKQKNIINTNKNNELKQKLLLTQMNPHFIFNSVDNIQSLIHNKQDKDAINYLTKFSKLTRQILENSTQNYITLKEELEMTDNYLTIQQLLYNHKFTYKITVDETIDTESVMLPPMLTQPFIENAVKHGLKHKTEGGFIDVQFYMKAQSLFFEVSDNGSGLETKEVDDTHRSLATQIVTERLKNNTTKKIIVINTQNIIENNNVKGVKTMFEIPYIYDN